MHRTVSDTVAELLAGGDASAPALAEPGGPGLTYGALRATIDDFARELRGRGIAAGDTVALAVPNGLGIVAAFLGITRARAIAAPLNPAYTRDEFAFYLEDIGPALLLVPPGAGAAAREAAAALGIPVADVTIAADGRVSTGATPDGAELEPPCADDVALFLHTSGTTSRPKGVPLRHVNLCASADNIARWYRLTPQDVSLCVMPLFHIHGIVFSTLAFLGVGASVVVPPKFSASAFWPAVREYGATVVSAVPTIYRTLLLRADDDGAPHAWEHTLRFLRSSSSALPAAEFHKLEARFGVPVIEAYSMTEAAHQMCANPLDGERRAGSVGVGAHVEVAIMDDAGTLLPPHGEGEVVVRGRNVMRGYHNNPEANAAAFTHGWFRTGDRGKLDERGYLTLVGRIKELINRGGEKISPVEIDEVLAKHPGVVEAVTFALPDEKYGEDVAAAVIVCDGVTEGELADHVRAHLAPFKVPKRFFLTDAIPKTATGKVQRRLVAAAFAPPG
ncbi:AMP-dependent synthetase [Vulcanimicrobium alpinum]|uniref:AMP-dependent synthetase n=1 Tax=Vulcanimicrobium alpinum TaxID=3016050 RepID=A0AAN2C9S0_UNVUL|nr:acyl--CoA ligase [Vulcanimicrobium alpinum]BDE06599.1 AMP-dependent synthetase [Vulcanimicrobium alpinum]